MVYLKYASSYPGVLKIGTLMLGTVVLGIGCHSYFSSLWSSNHTAVIAFCDSCPQLECPNVGIMLEKFFIAVILLLHLFSLLHFLEMLFFKEMTENAFRIFDIVYHLIGGLLLIIGGALYITSAVKVKQIDDAVDKKGYETLQFYEEKIVAGVFSLINALLYIGAGATTYLIEDTSRGNEVNGDRQTWPASTNLAIGIPSDLNSNGSQRRGSNYSAHQWPNS